MGPVPVLVWPEGGTPVVGQLVRGRVVVDGAVRGLQRRLDAAAPRAAGLGCTGCAFTAGGLAACLARRPPIALADEVGHA